MSWCNEHECPEIVCGGPHAGWQEERIAELEAEVARLREALKAAGGAIAVQLADSHDGKVWTSPRNLRIALAKIREASIGE